MALNQNIVIRLMADSADYTAKMQAASASATQLSTALEKPMSKSERFAATGQKVALGVGALSAAVGVAAVKAFADFDESMSAVKSNTGATGKTLDDLTQAALEAGAVTVFSATESADAINELAKAGVSTKDILTGGLTGALDLAASGQMGVADAAELTASALNEFGLEGKQASHVADLLAAGANTAQGGVQDMGSALKMVGVSASQLGMSIEETTGALTMMASKGIVGSDAGTQLRSALIGLTSASGPARKEMERLGISMYDSQGQFVGLADFAGQLKEKLSVLTPEQRANTMGILFSNAAMSVGNTLYEQGAEGVNNFTKQVNQQGFAAKQAAELTDNLKGDVEQFGGAVETSLIKIGSGANGPIRKTVQGVTDLVTAFGNLPAPVQQTVVMLGLASGAAAGLHKIFGNTAQSTSALSRSFGLVVDPVQRVQAAMGHFRTAVEQVKLSTVTYEEQMRRMGTATSAPTMRMSALKSVGSGIVDLLGGPWGIALAAAGAALSAWSAHAEQAKAAARQLSEAMEATGDDSEALIDQLKTGDNIDWGWFQKWNTGFGSLRDMLDAAGISWAEWTKAVQGDGKALESTEKKIRALSDTNWHSIGIIDEYNTKLSQQQKAHQKSVETSEKSKAAKEELADADKKGADAAGALADAQGDAAEKEQKAADASSILTNNLNATSKGLDAEAAALGEVVSALKQYYGFKLSAFDADTKWGKALNTAEEALKKNGAGLDANTEKGQANRDALKGLVDAADQSAEAHARNGEGIEKVSQVMDEGREKFIHYAKAMGMSEEDANAFADSVGLSSERVNDLMLQVERTNAKPLKIKDEASSVLDKVKAKAEGLADGKTIRINGDDKDYMEKVSQVTQVEINPKTGTLDLDKKQFDIALALANGARIDPKTGQLLADNNKFWDTLARTQGWTIDPKTGIISAEDSSFRAAKAYVDSMPATQTKSITFERNFIDKYIKTGGSGSSIPGMPGGPPMATGGLVMGPGTGTSDDVPARLSNGEYVIRAAAVKQYGVQFLDALNLQRFATGGLVRQYAAAPVPQVNDVVPNVQVPDAGVVAAIEHLEGMLGPIISEYAPKMGERDFARQARKAVGI